MHDQVSTVGAVEHPTQAGTNFCNVCTDIVRLVVVLIEVDITSDWPILKAFHRLLPLIVKM